MNDTGFLVLAAGSSHRFGNNKLLAPLPSGMSLLETTLRRLPQDHRVHVVCHPKHHDVQALLRTLHLPFSKNPKADYGMASSITHGITQTSEWPGWIICLADMPWIQTTTYQQIAQAITPDRIVVPITEHQGKALRGNPVGFGRHFRDKLISLQGDVGAKPLIATHARCVQALAVKDDGILLDIDYPDDINMHVID